MNKKLEEKLDKLIEQQKLTNVLLYRILGGEEEEDGHVKCPSCSKDIEPNDLGYCPKCNADVMSALARQEGVEDGS